MLIVAFKMRNNSLYVIWNSTDGDQLKDCRKDY